MIAERFQGLTISPVNMEARKNLGIKPGDTVRVFQKIEEKGKTRLQAFEGLVLAVKHGSEPGATFTVRRVSGGVGVEKIFPLYSPVIDKIEITRRSKVRRAKLYYIREKVAKEIRRQMRNMKMVELSTGSDIAEKDEAEKAQSDAEESQPTPTSEEESADTEVKTEAPEETPQAETQKEPDSEAPTSAEAESEPRTASVGGKEKTS